jgi:hypothetical protein
VIDVIRKLFNLRPELPPETPALPAQLERREGDRRSVAPELEAPALVKQIQK